MNINEILTSVPAIANYHNSRIEFEGLEMFCRYNDRTSRSDLTIFREEEEIGFIYMEGAQIKCSDIYPAARGKGFGKLAYWILLEINGILISDNSVSEMAFNVYSSLGRDFKLIEHPRLSLDDYGYRAPQWCFILKK